MYKIYQVEYGDTIDVVATKTGTTRENIISINGFNGNEELEVGSLIIVPKNENSFFTKYVVNNGDTVYSIARLYNIDPNLILLLNGLNKDDYIYPNQELSIPNSDITAYVTRKGDTIDFIVNNLGIDANTLNDENRKIYVVEDQLIIHKKEGNN